MSWIKSKDLKPEYNVSVLVFIPEEDNHVTTGMWDISKKWVLLDEYRVPRSEVTYWRPMVDRPKDTSYTPTHEVSDEDTTVYTIRSLQKQVFDLQSERDKLAEENERLKAELYRSKVWDYNTRLNQTDSTDYMEIS